MRLARSTPGPRAVTAAAILTATVAPGLGGCGGSGPEARPVSTIPSKPIWHDEAPAEPTPEVAGSGEPLDRHAADLQAMFDQLGAAPEPVAAAEPAEAPASRSAARPAEPAATEPAPVVSAEPDPATPATIDAPAADAAPHSPEPEPETIDTLSARLAAMLATGADDARPPLARALRLAGLGLVHPGAGAAELEALERTLLPAEAAVLRPLREMMSRLGAAGPSGETGTDPAEVASLVAQCAASLESERPLTLPAAVLCERVESFGRYTPFASTTFAAGREHAAILYVEVEHFAQRNGAASSGGEWETELAQSVDLYHDADGSLQWRRPEQVVRDTARRRRTDYYLVQRITLPATLSVGRYNLKVTVTDRISGRTAQARVPVQIVADPALVQKPSH